jgi:putative membrane protein insertion efficiency factor
MLKGRSATLSMEKHVPEKELGPVSRIVRVLAMVLIRGYQLILSPVMPGSCRFSPSCSHYALEAFQRHAPVRAFWLTVRRIGRCHPFHPGGNDPVP